MAITAPRSNARLPVREPKRSGATRLRRMPLYRVVAQRLFEQAEGLQVLGGASGDEPCAPAAPAEFERQRPELRRAGRCPMMARRGAERSA